MDSFNLLPTNETPEVSLNASKGLFTFKGKSYPENVNEFYEPILRYIQEYTLQPQEKTTLEFNWLYFNTATSKIIVKLILELKAVKANGKHFQIRWLCKANDDLMLEKGEEFKDLLDVDFSIIHV